MAKRTIPAAPPLRSFAPSGQALKARRARWLRTYGRKSR